VVSVHAATSVDLEVLPGTSASVAEVIGEPSQAA
jgi:hypothetical protein